LTGDDSALRERALHALRTVRDPELPLSIVDLGLIYDVEVDGGAVRVEMTLTSMGCPCHEMIHEDVRAALAGLPGVAEVEVDVVWDPPWSRDRITPAGRQALRSWAIQA
jgi:phenylacetate-CoA oxygenase PaaJ subunit